MSQELPEGTVAAFETLCGATVVIVEAGLLPKARPASPDRTGYTWQCLGCLTGTTSRHVQDEARDKANGHAGQCRSKPLPTV